MLMLLKQLFYLLRIAHDLLRQGFCSSKRDMLLLLPLLLFLQPAHHNLTLRLRAPDGRPVVGLAVTLLKLPDHVQVGWQNADNTCYTNESGECNWQVSSGLYEFVFPIGDWPGYQPDPVTLVELGEGGLNSLAVFLDRDATVGIVLADPHTRTAGDTLFFDRAPHAALPQFVVPDANTPASRGQHDPGSPGLEPTLAGLAHLEETPVVTEVEIAGPITLERGRLISFWFVFTAALIVGIGFVAYQRWQIRRRESLLRQRVQTYAARRVED